MIRTQRGFTLIEVLVSLMILGLALSGTAFFLTLNSNNAQLIKDNYIAGALIQEGMEAVRNIRDRDWFLGSAFGASIPDGTWRVQWNSSTLLVDSAAPLKKDAGTGIFSYDSGSDTIFKRKVDITTVQSGIEKKAVVTVTWTERGNAKSLTAEDHLYNWK